MAELKITLLGPPRIELDNKPVATDRRKAVALLAYLAVTAVSHSRESLAALFWPESDQSRAYAYLRRTLWELHQMLGEGWLEVNRETVALPHINDLWLDTTVFSKLIHAQLPESLPKAADLYQGEFMAGFTLRDAPGFDDWQLLERESKQREIGRCLQQLVELSAEGQRWETAVVYAQRWLALDALNEEAHRQLMQVYAQSGQRAAALTQYEKCVAILAEDLAVSPEPATVSLWQAIKAGKVSAAAVPIFAEQPKPQIVIPHNLPEQPTPFVGRSPELESIRELLMQPETHLLTLVGQGGSGKTRLAIETANGCLEIDDKRFPDGIYFVPLGWLDSPGSILATVAYTLDFHFFDDESTSPQMQLVEYLASKQMLLVLDNYEHLLEKPGLDLPLSILAKAPGVKILATSRVRLNVRGEQIFKVSGMQMPTEITAVSWDDPESANEYSAVRLFVQQAKRIQPDFVLTAQNSQDVVRICQLVDGLPLGIELAVAWLPLLAPSEIADEIENSLDFLISEQKDVPQRQRSLRAVFEYSWNLLSPEEQAVYQKLSIFRGSFSRESAQAVAGASLRDLMGLMNKSLVWRDCNGRYQLHELLRQYAAERLQSDPAQQKEVQSQFSHFFVNFLISQLDIMKGPAQKTAFDQVEAEEENVKQAWLWAVEQKAYQTARKAMDGLLMFYMARSLYKDLNEVLKTGLDLVETAVVAGETDRQTQLMRVTIMAYLGWTAHDEYVKYFPNNLAEQAMPLVQELAAEDELGLGYVMLASVYTWNVNREVGLQYFRESVERIRQSGDPHALAVALSVLGGTLTSLNFWDEARELLLEAIALNRKLENQFMLAISLQTLGYAEGISRHYERAFQIYEECQQIYLDLCVLRGAASVCFDMGDVSAAMGQYRQGMDWMVSARELYEQCGDRRSIAGTFSWQSIMAMRLGDLETAVSLRQQAEQEYKKNKDQSGLAWSYWESGEIFRVKEDFTEAREQYKVSLSLFKQIDDTWGIAYYHRGLAEIALHNEQLDQAKSHFEQSLTSLRTQHHPWGSSYVRSGLSQLFVRQGELGAARVELIKAIELSLTQGDKGLLLHVLGSVITFLEAENESWQAAALAAYVSSHIAAWWETRQRVRELLVELEQKLDPGERQGVRVEYQLVSLDDMILSIQQQLKREPPTP